MVAMGTQFRVSSKGAYALDYTALPVVMDLCGVEKTVRHRVFEDLRVLEDQALETIRGGK